MSETTGPIRESLRTALREAMRSRDRPAATVYRSALGAIDNAEAVPIDPGTNRAGAVEQASVGVGSTETARRELSEAEIHAIVAAERDDHAAAADELTGLHERALEHRRAADLLDAILRAAG